MQDRKEYILEKAFEVFMAKGYDSASMTVLQKELNMSRGAMYRYYDGKEALFKAVIDKYVFGIIDYVMPKLDIEMTLAEKIESSYSDLKKISKFLDTIERVHVVFLNYTALIIQAAKRYPGFLERTIAYKEKDLKAWRISIENSIKKGEIRQDVNVKIMAAIFAKAFGANDSDRPERKFSKVIEDTKKSMDYIYSLIKI